MWILIFGTILLVIELLLVNSFYILWYGIGFILSGGIGWLFGYENYTIQGFIGVAIGAILMFLFRKKLLSKIFKINNKDEFLLEKGRGVVLEDSLVKFRGTTWKYENRSDDTFETGEEVLVIPATNNNVFIEKITKKTPFYM